MKTTLAASVLLTGVSVAGSSWASYNVCNYTSNTVYTALVAEDPRRDSLSGVCYPYPYLASWWEVAPNGGCTEVWNQVLDADCMDAQFFWYAEDTVGDYWGGTSGQYCPMNSTTTEFWPQNACTASWVGFAEGNWGGYNTYTVNLY